MVSGNEAPGLGPGPDVNGRDVGRDSQARSWAAVVLGGEGTRASIRQVRRYGAHWSSRNGEIPYRPVPCALGLVAEDAGAWL
ncbi:MAG: hypothetical protein LBP92_07735 [Deltaproteobacteria bacterium]|nr:hypothetical protein [Deltaproteobacteria bacterium]